jgi:hypothetical protein
MDRVGPIALIVAALGAAAVAAQEQSTFRTATDVVTVDVSVEQDHRRVAGLTSADFIVTDNTVRQEVDAVSSESLPANVTLLVDTPGSATSLDALRRDVRAAADLLHENDQLRLLSCAGETTLVSPMQPARVPLPLDRLSVGGRSILMDSVAISLFRKRPPDRGELVVAFTRGLDGGSTMSDTRLRNIAQRTEAVLHVVVIDTPGRGVICSRSYSCKDKLLETMAKATGGRLVKKKPDAVTLPATLKDALDDFHTSYTLRYTARGVARAGWHEIAVKIARPGRYTVRARRGYVGG